MRAGLFQICLLPLLTAMAFTLPGAAVKSAAARAAPAFRPKTELCGLPLPRESYPRNLLLSLHAQLSRRADLLTVVDKTHTLPPAYRPADLARVEGPYQLQREAAKAFQQMAAAARKDGVRLYVQSAYRSHSYQSAIYNRSLKRMGAEHTQKYIAPPGASQHQLGLAVDINSTVVSFQNTPAFRWLSANAGKYGWSISFPEEQQAKTGFAYEPWHYRYVTPAGAQMQQKFFAGSQHDMLAFFAAC